MGNGMDPIIKELQKINHIIQQANEIDAVKRVVRASLSKNQHSQVIGGEYVDQPGYNLVVKHNGNNETVKRRLRGSFEDIEVESIVDNMLGIRFKKDKS